MLFNANERNMVIPTGRRQTSWLFTKRGRGDELGSTKKQLQLSGQSGTRTRDLRSGFKVQRPNHSTTLPPQTHTDSIQPQLTYSIHFGLAAVQQHWRSIRDDKTRKTNNSFEKHRDQAKQSFKEGTAVERARARTSHRFFGHF